MSGNGHAIELYSILRLFGAADLSVARLFEGHINAIGLVELYGSANQLEELARDISAGALAAVWAADDALGLHLIPHGNAWRLKGRKILASGAGFVTRPIVTATSSKGQVLCLLRLPKGYAHDLSCWDALGMRATATAAVDFTDRRVGLGEIVGGVGDYMRQPHFSGGAWRFCAAHLGAMERLVDLFRDHLLSTGRSDDPYQVERVASCIVAAKTTRFWVEESARRLANDDFMVDEIAAFANLTRLVTERSALRVMENVQRGIGLRAFVKPNPIERISRDLATYLRQPAPDRAMNEAVQFFMTNNLGIGDF